MRRSRSVVFQLFEGSPIRTRGVVLGFRALTGVLLVIILAACGQSTNGQQSKPASQVLADAKKAMADLGNFHCRCFGDSIVLSPSRGGGTLTSFIGTWDVVEADGFVYLKANAATWYGLFKATLGASEAESEAQSFAGKWGKAPASNPYISALAPLAEVVDERDLLYPLSHPSSLGSLSKRSTTDVNGTKAVALVFSKGFIVYIADSGPPYILKISEYTYPHGPSAPISEQSLTFDEFGTAIIPSVPTGATNLPTS